MLVGACARGAGPSGRSAGRRGPPSPPFTVVDLMPDFWAFWEDARALPEAEGPEAERCREVIVLTINGIAAGLRNTG